ncbi:hypothetical protein Sme01_22580 [Sphaerisporangium melleum]|uniref:Activator of Hsp90 ATPase homologue 1/2-like C-terminal domain-containing protein n=1 Tax=Sphaerisporangium melleum TaxID=321316 RepID=A0A917R014_9ACTN|nr:SRPBCC family protein [Sphaerisporangium melleum]GGK78759.1 hypothetical protein GCM10007964_21790 [Sphaerisporangium melleum]GII69782.1 hypothetical protein Sme01_22580 [Sphaerisporangium melleum]
MDLGTYIEHQGRPAVRFERTYDHPIGKVWTAVATPEGLAHWFPSAVELEPHAGGKISFAGDPHMEPSTGTIVAFEPPRRLAFTWFEDELHFELEPLGEGRCRLTLVNVLGEADTAARNAAGWSVCLNELDRHVAGAQAEGPHSATAAPWRPYYDAYLAAGLPSGAPVPGMTDDSPPAAD